MPGRRPEYRRHPDFPTLPESTPLTYVLAMMACLSSDLAERPTFLEMAQIFRDVQTEVRSGQYIDSCGHVQVRLIL
jgi:hypothetical protein